MVYNKCMRLAPWTSTYSNTNEDAHLLHNPEDSANTRSGLLTNLVSQDTYNIMSCVWICHYVWAIPLKVPTCSLTFTFRVFFLNFIRLAICFFAGRCNIVFTIPKTRRKCSNRHCSWNFHNNPLTVLYWKEII